MNKGESKRWTITGHDITLFCAPVDITKVEKVMIDPNGCYFIPCNEWLLPLRRLSLCAMFLSFSSYVNKMIYFKKDYTCT